MTDALEPNVRHHTARRISLIPWILGTAILILTVLDVIMIYRNLPYMALDEVWGFRGFQAALSIPLSFIGSVIAARRPRNPIGWLFLVSAALGVISELAGEYAFLAFYDRSVMLPGADFAAWLTSWVWAPGAAAYLSFSFLYFPTGMLVSPRWRRVVWFSAAALVVVVLFFAFVPGSYQLSGIKNPYAVEALSPLENVYFFLPQTLLLIPALLAAASLVIRFRLSAGAERQQLKWFVLAAVFAPTAIILGNFREPWANLGLILIVVSIPSAMAVAILRYRLYSIDIIINRTLVYGALTGALAAVYFGSVLLLQRLLPAQSQLAVVLSTLAVAALFSPLRGRIQGDIDRIFYRRKYNAERILKRFSRAARDEVDLDQLSERLLAVIGEAIQPEEVSLWIRTPRPGRSPFGSSLSEDYVEKQQP